MGLCLLLEEVNNLCVGVPQAEVCKDEQRVRVGLYGRQKFAPHRVPVGGRAFLLCVVEKRTFGEDHRVVQHPGLLLEHTGVGVAKEDKPGHPYIMLGFNALFAKGRHLLAKLLAFALSNELFFEGLVFRLKLLDFLGETVAHTWDLVDTLDHANLDVVVLSKDKRMIAFHSLKLVGVHLGRIKRGEVVEFAFGLDVGVNEGDRNGGGVDCDTCWVACEELQVGGVIVVGVGQEHSARSTTFTKSGIQGALKLRDVKECLVVGAGVACESPVGVGNGPGLPLTKRLLVMEKGWRGRGLRCHESSSISGCRYLRNTSSIEWRWTGLLK